MVKKIQMPVPVAVRCLIVWAVAFLGLIYWVGYVYRYTLVPSTYQIASLFHLVAEKQGSTACGQLVSKCI